MRLLWIVVPLLALPGALFAARTHDTNPLSGPADFQKGKRLYRINCGVCHGMDGKTGRGARLARRSYRHGNSDAELFDLIEAGVPGTDMPGLWLDEDDIWRILLYVRTFAAKASESCDASGGDAAAGKAVFETKGACLACHTVGSGGGRLGPDMTYAGELFTDDQLRQSLLQPSAHVERRYRTVRLTTADGKQVEGVKLNENAYNIFLMDRSETIRSFRKADLASLDQPDESLMPAYGDALSAAELDDLVAYLCSLRGGPAEAGR